MSFVHCHVHSEVGSLLDGAIKIKDLPKIAKQYGMPAIALSDHGSLSGSLEFYRECKKENIKPLLSIETYLTKDKDDLENEQKTRDNFHFILLAKNEVGWKNLMWLSSHAYLHNFYYKPRINLQVLADHSEGLIGQSACIAGLCYQSGSYDAINKTFSDPDHAAEKSIGMFNEMFRGDFYLEMMHNSMPEQIAYNQFLIHMGKKLNIKNIITADAHYLSKQDEPLHEMLMAMQSKKTIQQYKEQDYFHYEICYIRPPNEMLEAAKSVGNEEAFHNSMEVASKVDLNIELGVYKLPKYSITEDIDYEEFKNAQI